jgi:hypothetical protein
MTGVMVPLELELLELPELELPELLDRLLEEEEPELLEPKVALEPETLEADMVELVLEPELPETEVVLEPELLEPELPLPCRTTVPVRIGLALSGVTVSVLPDVQYEYCGPGGDEVVITLLPVVSMPLADAELDTTPIPPACWTVAEHAHPPAATAVHVTEA